MKDITGREIKVGDTVVFGLPSKYVIALGKVVAINKKTVRILYAHQVYDHRVEGLWRECETEYLRPFADVVVVQV